MTRSMMLGTMVLGLMAGASFAEESKPPPKVELTQEQLKRLMTAEVAGALAQEKAMAARDVYEAIDKAFGGGGAAKP